MRHTLLIPDNIWSTAEVLLNIINPEKVAIAIEAYATHTKHWALSTVHVHPHEMAVSALHLNLLPSPTSPTSL